MAKKLKDILVRQKLTFDNHHPNVEARWDNNLHFHKKMTIDDHGEKAEVSGIVYVGAKKSVEVQWDHGNNNHAKIKDPQKAKRLRDKLFKEVSEALKNDDNQTHAFLDNIWKHLQSINAGIKEEEKVKRFKEAYDNIMDAIGISKDRKVDIRNKEENKGLFSLYVDDQNINDAHTYIKETIIMYNRRFPEFALQREPHIFFICYHDSALTIGELTPGQQSQFRRKGYRLSGIGVEDAIINEE